jgi:hypothetical protein
MARIGHHAGEHRFRDSAAAPPGRHTVSNRLEDSTGSSPINRREQHDEGVDLDSGENRFDRVAILLGAWSMPPFHRGKNAGGQGPCARAAAGFPSIAAEALWRRPRGWRNWCEISRTRANDSAFTWRAAARARRKRWSRTDNFFAGISLAESFGHGPRSPNQRQPVVGDSMEITHSAATCRWAAATLYLSPPLWLDACDRPWTCLCDSDPRPLLTTDACASCRRWKPHAALRQPVGITDLAEARRRRIAEGTSV